MKRTTLVRLATPLALLLAAAAIGVWLWPGRVVEIALLAGGLMIAWLLWDAPRVQVEAIDETPIKRFELENEARKTLAQVIGGVGLAVGLYFTSVEMRNAQYAFTEQQRLSSKSTHIDLYSGALEQLKLSGDDNSVARKGAVYALEQVAIADADFRRPIIELLVATFRHHRGRFEPLSNDKRGIPVSEAQTILDIIGRRRNPEFETGAQRINLGGTNLNSLRLSGSFEGALLSGTTIRGTSFEDACLAGADFTLSEIDAFVTRTDLRHARFNHLDVRLAGDADLRGASFVGGAELVGDMKIEPTLVSEGSRLTYNTRSDPDGIVRLADQSPSWVKWLEDRPSYDTDTKCKLPPSASR